MAGILTGFFPIVYLLFVNAALHDWWLQSIVMQIPFAQNTSGITANQLMRSLLATRYWRTFYFNWIWIVIPLSCVGVFLHGLYKRIRPELLIVSGLGIASWHQYYPVVERLHFFWAVTPMIGVFVYVLYRINKQLLFVFYVAVFLNLFWGIWNGVARARVASFTTSSLPVIKGIMIPQMDKEYHENIVSTLQTYFSLYPDRRYINDAINSFYPLYSPEHFHAFHGVFVDWDVVTVAVYPMFEDEMKTYIRDQRPLIFTRHPENYPDYCDMNIVPWDTPTVLIIPKEIGKDLQRGWVERAPNLREFSCDSH
jgi:hypothetical protein